MFGGYIRVWLVCDRECGLLKVSMYCYCLGF